MSQRKCSINLIWTMCSILFLNWLGNILNSVWFFYCEWYLSIELSRTLSRLAMKFSVFSLLLGTLPELTVDPSLFENVVMYLISCLWRSIHLHSNIVVLERSRVSRTRASRVRSRTKINDGTRVPKTRGIEGENLFDILYSVINSTFQTTIAIIIWPLLRLFR